MTEINLNTIKQAIATNNVRITSHAVEEAENDDLLIQDIYFSVNSGEIIENYPDDYPFPSCLICGFDATHQPIHSIWAYNEKKSLAILVTVYRPDPNLWINWRTRR